MYEYYKKSSFQEKKPQEQVSKNFINPYNFVPVHDGFCEIDWSQEISHDIPFSDGISGKIFVKFKSETPIIIKDGNSSNFIKTDGNPFIPGTSIKGMIRNNLEILSLSKISNLTKDNRYSMRDLSPHNKDYTIKQNLNKVKAGFLISIKGNYYLIESPEYERIYYKEFDELLNEERIGEQIQKSSKVSQKYKLARNKLFYEYDDDSKWAVVLTGKMFNKKAEYGFMFPKTINPKKVPDNVIKNFMFVYEKETYSDTWKFWKKKIKIFSSEPTIGELTKEICWVPVFYMNNNNEEICHLGLTFLYREPFPNSIHSLIPKNHANNKVLDFAEALFGLANKENMIRGRVAFSNGHFENYEEDTVREIVLGSPKPTFFPFYLVQDKNKPFTTFSNSEAKINGWKRYIPHKYVSDTNFTNDNANVRTRIKPIKPGGTFQIVIHFHNLKSVELGALLSALTFHNNYENCFHLIGMGKPLGYGKVKVQEIAIDKADTDIKTHMANFESYICDKMFGGNFEQWKNAVLKLFSYAMENSAGKEIRYPKAFDEFKAIKKQKLNITDFSPDNTNFKLKSLKQTKI